MRHAHERSNTSHGVRWCFTPRRTIGTKLVNIIPSKYCHSIQHVETLLEALKLAPDSQCHTAQSAPLRLGGAHLPEALEKEV